MIVGKIDEKTLARRMQQSRRESARLRASEKAKKFLAVAPFTALGDLSERLREQKAEAEKMALRRRKTNGRWVTRQAQAEAIALADRLDRLGF